MDDIIVRNYEQTKKEILVGYDKDSFYEDWQQNETWEIGLSVTNLINQEVFDLIEYESSIIFNGQEFIIKKMTENVVGGLVTKQIVATHIYYTIQDGYQYEKVTGTKSINQLLTHIFKAGNRGFTWEIIDPNKKFLTVQQENFGDGNYLKLINELLSDYNAVVIPNKPPEVTLSNTKKTMTALLANMVKKGVI